MRPVCTLGLQSPPYLPAGLLRLALRLSEELASSPSQAASSTPGGRPCPRSLPSPGAIPPCAELGVRAPSRAQGGVHEMRVPTTAQRCPFSTCHFYPYPSFLSSPASSPGARSPAVALLPSCTLGRGSSAPAPRWPHSCWGHRAGSCGHLNAWCQSHRRREGSATRHSPLRDGAAPGQSPTTGGTRSGYLGSPRLLQLGI